MLKLEATFSESEMGKDFAESEMGKDLPRGSVYSCPRVFPAEQVPNTNFTLSSNIPNKEN